MASHSDSTQPKSPRASGWDYQDEEITGVTVLSAETRELVACSQARKACLTVLVGGNLGETFLLGPGETVLGRGNQAQVRLPGEGISRRHARIVRIDNAVTVEDGSANGTFVNDQRIERAELREGDKIRLASTSVLECHDRL